MNIGGAITKVKVKQSIYPKEELQNEGTTILVKPHWCITPTYMVLSKAQ